MQFSYFIFNGGCAARELAFQISEQFAVLGMSLNIRTAVIVGGMDMMAQALELGNRPHVVVATPGRIVDHLRSSNSGEWDLSRVKFLVFGSSFWLGGSSLTSVRFWMKLTDCSHQLLHRNYRISLVFFRKRGRHVCLPRR
jgi:hypothetical protein